MLSVGDCIAVFYRFRQKLLCPTLVNFVAILLNEANDITLPMVGFISQKYIRKFSIPAVVSDAASADVQSVYQFLGTVHSFTSQVENSFVVAHIHVIHQQLYHLFLSVHLLYNASHALHKRVLVQHFLFSLQVCQFFHV